MCNDGFNPIGKTKWVATWLELSTVNYWAGQLHAGRRVGTRPKLPNPEELTSELKVFTKIFVIRLDDHGDMWYYGYTQSTTPLCQGVFFVVF